MTIALRVLATVAFLLLPCSASTSEAKDGDRFASLRFLIGHCWQGDFGDGRIDTQCYDQLFDHAFVRSRHEVTKQGDSGPRYGGVTIFSWDGVNGRIHFHYFASTGAVSEGHFAAADENGLLIPERHVASDGTVTEIETRYSPVDDESYRVVSRSRVQEEWRVMFEAEYRRVDEE